MWTVNHARMSSLILCLLDEDEEVRQGAQGAGMGQRLSTRHVGSEAYTRGSC